MPYTVEFDASIPCVRALLTGTFDLEAARECARAAVEAAKENGCHNILYDGRQAANAMPVSDLYRLPVLLEADGMGRSYRRALLVSTQTQDLRFYETASRNRGYAVRVFDDETRAIIWLTESGERTS